MSKVVLVRGEDRKRMIEVAFSALGIRPHGRIVVKPNLVIDKPYPTTTHPECVDAILSRCSGELLIAEGSGFCNTMDAYRKMGFDEVARKHGASLVDLNDDEYEVVEGNALVLKKFEMPLTLKDSYVISAAVLKKHSITKVTLSLKNMIGASIGSKGKFHSAGIEESIVDINMYVRPKLGIIDGIYGNLDGELGRKPKRFGVLIASTDLVAADCAGCNILGVDPLSVKHIRLAEKVGLGSMEYELIEEDV